MSPEDPLKTWFSSQVQANLDAMFGVACRLTGDRTGAEDLVADTVTRAWASIDSLQDRSRFRSWIFRILRNTHISAQRKSAVRPREMSYYEHSDVNEPGDLSSWLIDQPEEFLAWWADPERACSNTMLADQIRLALDELPGVFRVTVILINVDGLTYDETAEVLGVPTGTVRSRMKRGRALLQKALWKQAQDAGLAAAGEWND